MSSPPLSILQVGAWFPKWGGTELHLLALSEELTRRGHSVTVACKPGAFVAEEAARRGLRTVPAVCENLLDFQAFGVFLNLLRGERFDLVHVHWHEDHAVAPLAARLRGVPVFATHHFPRPIPLPLAALHGPDLLFRRVLTVSESVRGVLLRQGLAPEKVVTVHHGTDVAAFRELTRDAAAVRREWAVPPGAVLVGLVGQVLPHKGVSDFLAALSLLKDDPVPVHGVIVGDGAARGLAEAEAHGLGLGERLVFAGFRPDVNNAIGALDVLVLASTWAEPCAAVVQQAMALGKPVVGTRTGGTPEMVADGETGLLIPPRDPAGMAAAIAALASDPARRERMGQAGLARVRDRFTLSGMTGRVVGLYRDALAGEAE